MKETTVRNYLSNILLNMPKDWLLLTTHRLDIYDESQAKSEFIEEFDKLFHSNDSTHNSLASLPTAYDYIRLGHPLSCVLEWAIAQLNGLATNAVISFDSQTIPFMAIFRTNRLANKSTRIVYEGKKPSLLNESLLRDVYVYQFELKEIEKGQDVEEFDGSTIFWEESNSLHGITILENVDFFIQSLPQLGTILMVNGTDNQQKISDIQHVRRRETVAMTPSNCEVAVKSLVDGKPCEPIRYDQNTNHSRVVETIKSITGANTTALLGSSGLSVQYAIMMGLVDHAYTNHPGKEIKIIVPPNCYGGTNDQARRVAASIDHVEVMDLPVDGDHNMVQSIDLVLDQVAKMDAVPYIIAEIPTNPRVEVPDMEDLKRALTTKRNTPSGEAAIEPVFILDQTFCPNVHFLGQDRILADVMTIAYVSGSKFPSGGRCTAGYCVANQKAAHLLEKIELHLNLCDNAATPLQMEILAEQLPSMNDRIHAAYKNTRAFVNYIEKTLPTAKINFVSEELAGQGFTPSVFSLDIPSRGDNEAEREAHKRELNLKLINMMINAIPNESKYCVSYGQLKGCYWTIPATSTQGTTKEGDKDYIVRVALSGNMDLEKHKAVFKQFVDELS